MVIYWMTGLSGSGKTTIAMGARKLCSVEVLEGDQLRKGLCKNLGYSNNDRIENLRRIAHLSTLLDKYTNVIVACITPYESARSMVRRICRDVHFIYIRASLEECRRRDPKGLYAKADRGELLNFTGVDDVFETPISPDFTIETGKQQAKQSIDSLVEYIQNTSLNESGQYGLL